MPLAVALGQATTKAADYLTGLTRETEGDTDEKPGIATPTHVNDITIEGIDSEVERRLAEVQREISVAAQQHPDKKVRISWWLE